MLRYVSTQKAPLLQKERCYNEKTNFSNFSLCRYASFVETLPDAAR